MTIKQLIEQENRKRRAKKNESKKKAPSQDANLNEERSLKPSH